jgi:hypothetical protein
MNLRPSALPLAVAAALLGSCATQEAAAPPNVLVAARVNTAPVLDAMANDAAWASAKAITIDLEDGANFAEGKGESTVTLKAAYTADMLYMLIQYKDPTNSVRRGPYQKQADGSWKKLKDPADKGGDDNVYYEDKWAMLWPTNEATAKQFDKEGCAMACHEGTNQALRQQVHQHAGPDPGHVAHEGQRTGPLGFVDDQYTDDTRYRPEDGAQRRPQGRPRPAGRRVHQYRARQRQAGVHGP